MKSSPPVFSIITVVLNRAHDIKYTLESIKNQDYPHVQFIVVDGGSTDGTAGIIEQYSSSIQVIISEKDHGIYDAMNKGLDTAAGDYVLFINGGDALHSTSTLSSLASVIVQQNRPDIVYGECMFIDQSRNHLGIRSELRRNPLPKQLNYYSFKRGSNVTHQCFVVKRLLCPKYDLQYRWSSDIDWMLQCIKQSKVCINAHLIIADFVIGDASSQHFIQSMKERFKILRKHYGLKDTLLTHLYIIFLRPFN
jgi:glycosyltransferase involved in cell wall biosynthesis